jgi:hypothetical protein
MRERVRRLTKRKAIESFSRNRSTVIPPTDWWVPMRPVRCGVGRKDERPESNFHAMHRKRRTLCGRAKANVKTATVDFELRYAGGVKDRH